MIRLLYVKASPRDDRSTSHQVAQAYIDTLGQKKTTEVDTLDVWAFKLPPFDGAVLEAKYASLSGQPLTPGQREAWKEIQALGARFESADQIVFSVPMWNFGIPYKLKHLIDLVTQKDVTFRVSNGSFDGMLKRQRAVFVCARGLGYGEDGFPEEQFDYQKSYLISWAKFVGVTDIHTVVVEKNLLDAAEREVARAKAMSEARALATAT